MPPTLAAVLASHAPTAPPPAGASSRWRGGVDPELLAGQSQRGRRRRWVYAAAGDGDRVVGAAVVDVGLLGLGTAFAFATGPDGSVTWDAGPGRAGHVGGLDGRARLDRRDLLVEITPERLRLDVPVRGGRLRASVGLDVASPVSLLTATPLGGWNATTKAAGHAAAGTVELPAGHWDLDGAAWTDATDGRQDARTTWRWAAGAGRSDDGVAAVGLQASTGMNGVGPGEDLVWWDGEPVPIDVTTLEPVAANSPDGAWRIGGAGWALVLTPRGVRAATEGVGPVRSRYHQPIGTWRGTLPHPDGSVRPVWLAGVAEDHEARW